MEKNKHKEDRIRRIFLRTVGIFLVFLNVFFGSAFPVKAQQKEPVVYTVRKGDTLSQIALSFDTTVETLLSENEALTNPDIIYVGQELVIPSADRPPRTVILSPTNGPPGSKPELHGSGFDPYVNLELLIGPKDADAVLTYTERTGTNGTFHREIQIPENAAIGEHWIVATRPLQDQDAYLERSNAFHVTLDGEMRDMEQATIFLVALGDGGASGKPIGCNDSLVPVTVKIDRGAEPVRATLAALLKVSGPYHGQSGLYNSLYQSDLSLDRMDINNGVAYVYLTGTKKLGGTCDTPRFRSQVIETVNQFSNIRDASVYINNEHAFSETKVEGERDLSFYKVQPEETLSHIAVSFDTSIESLMDLNPQIERRSLIVVGQRLIIPGTDDDNPHAILMPTNGEPGTEVTVHANNLQPNTLYRIGVGKANSEYDLVADIVSDQFGEVNTQLTIPTFAGEDEFWVVVLDAERTQSKVVSNLFLVE